MVPYPTIWIVHCCSCRRRRTPCPVAQLGLNLGHTREGGRSKQGHGYRYCLAEWPCATFILCVRLVTFRHPLDFSSLCIQINVVHSRVGEPGEPSHRCPPRDVGNEATGTQAPINLNVIISFSSGGGLQKGPLVGLLLSLSLSLSVDLHPAAPTLTSWLLNCGRAPTEHCSDAVEKDSLILGKHHSRLNLKGQCSCLVSPSPSPSPSLCPVRITPVILHRL